MATEATIQILDTAVETTGVSTVTATRTVAAPRHGTIYNPTTFAAGVPVWFHRRQDGKYLALFSKRWTAATGVYHNGPQLFSAYTETVAPGIATIDPTTGTCDGPFLPPGNQPGHNTLTTAVSRGDFLFTLGTKDSVAWVQHHTITRNGGLQLQGEEEVPLGFQLGLYADERFLYVFGDDGSGRLARLRKNWGRIGNQTDPSMQWECEGEKGWYTDLTESLPMPGYPPADGPCSMAKFRDRFYLMTSVDTVGVHAGQAYTKRAVDRTWAPLGDPIVQGNDAAYMGGGVYLQPQLVVNTALLPDDANTGFPYVTSTKVTVGSDDGILTEWGILAV